MAIAECAELIKSINKLKRLHGIGENYIVHPSQIQSVDKMFGKVNPDIEYSLAYYEVCSEIADVKNMIAQLEMMFDKEAIQLAQERKIERLKDRLL